MKKYYKLNLLIFTMICLLPFGCIQDECKEEYTHIKYTPVYKKIEDLKKEVASNQPQELKNPGKIYFYNKFLLVNEASKGIHVIDLSNPYQPRNISFLNIQGNVDMAISKDILYADCYTDLFALDFSNPLDVSVVDHELNIFEILNWVNSYPVIDEKKGVIVDWQKDTVTDIYDCEAIRSMEKEYTFSDQLSSNSGGTSSGILIPTVNSPQADYTGSGNSNAYNSTNIETPIAGIAGSMARFAIVNEYLYALNDDEIVLLNISSPKDPGLFTKVNIGLGIETIFPYGNNLFIGSRNGMFIYDNSNPSSPVKISSISHITSCDPVVVEGNYAYVTLRNGNNCRGSVNELNVYNISNLTVPTLEASYNMYNPHGLGIDNKTLFICDGDAGLKVYDATDPKSIDKNLTNHFIDINAYDVIPYDELLMLVGKDGLYFYNYNEQGNMELVSSIEIVQDK